MFQIAKISFDAGTLLLPANDPYDREVVFEQADFYARRHGAVAVQIGSARIRAARSSEPGIICARCREPLRSVTFQVGESRFCTPCTKHAAGRAAELGSAPH
jgi:hypothetical protein